MNGPTSILLSHLMFIVTLIIGGALTGVQASFEHVAKVAIKKVQASPPSPAASSATANSIDNISDGILFAWACGGAMSGAYIGIAVGLTPLQYSAQDTQRDRTAKMARGFAVSLLTGILLTPYLVHNYVQPCRWSAVFLLGGGTSAGAWLIWNCFHAVLAKFVTRAKQDGISGVIEEAAKTKLS